MGIRAPQEGEGQKLPDLGELVNTLRKTTGQIEEVLQQRGLGEELEWLTANRKVNSQENPQLFDEFIRRAGAFRRKMEKTDPLFSLSDYWSGLDTQNQISGKS